MQNAFRNGWFHTGDAAVVHPDGYVEIRDRIKDIILSGVRIYLPPRSSVFYYAILRYLKPL